MINNINDIARNNGFLRLHRELNKFNIFHATGMKNQEIKHTQFLGYLLDPNESHGLKDEFLIRFIQSLPTPERMKDSNINILDFNLSYARITKEKTFSKKQSNQKSSSPEKNENRLDLLIEIPSLESPEQIYTIAIENKIRAKSGENQLENYKSSINQSYEKEVQKTSPILLYLSINEEELSDNSWTPILYSETIIPAINSLIDDLHETLSDYMIFILKDYIQFINEEGAYESENKLEEIITNIGPATINSIKNLLEIKPKAIEQQRLRTRYEKALNYIKKYDADPRIAILKHFRNQFIQGSGVHNKYKDFRLETSNRTRLRFSLLSEDNGKKLAAICQEPTKLWLESQQNLAFEITLTESETQGNINFRLSLFLGPTGVKYKKRTELLQKIRQVFKEHHKDVKVNIETTIRGHFDSIKKGAYKDYNKNDLTEEQAKEWINKTFEKLHQRESGFINALNHEITPLLNLDSIEISNQIY